MRYIQGHNRQQLTLLPASLDEYVTDENQVRVIDAFVDNQDLRALGFQYSEPEETGRPPYNPADISKLYLYGYLNRNRSSRRLEVETHRNIEVMWLMKMLRPDFKTIADFRKNNKNAIKKMCREFTLFCRKQGLFGLELFGIDGSKFTAVNHTSKAYTKNSLRTLIKKIDDRIDEYLQTLDQGDDDEKEIPKVTDEDIQRHIKGLKERRQTYQSYQQRMEQTGESQVVVTDPDSRLMKDGHKGNDVCYNVQFAIDNKNKLIAEYEVTNDKNDEQQLANNCKKIQDSFELKEFAVVADAGYFEKDAIKHCTEWNINCYVPEPNKSHNKHKGMYTNRDFCYDSQSDTYICPTGQTLKKTGNCIRHDRKESIYKTRACKTCPSKAKCTTSKEGRYLYRWEHEKIIEQMRDRLSENKEYIAKRRDMCEHPFGTIKHAFGYRNFLCKGTEMVNTEMSFTVLAYNMKRAINILGVKRILAALA
jgi:transposase